MAQSNAVLLELVESAIAQDKLILPSPPDIMLRVRHALEDPDISNQQLATIITVDAALSARIIKVANSSAFRRQQQVDNLSTAISSLGLKLLSTLVTNHTIMQLFAQPDEPYREFLQAIQAHSLAVAKLSYAITRQYTKLSAEDALLAGLVHDIGYLPLLQNMRGSFAEDNQDAEMHAFLKLHHPRIGSKLLRKWNFPEILVSAAGQHELLARDTLGRADLVDVVMVANLRCHHPNGVPPHISEQVPAFERLKMDPNSELSELMDYLEEASQLLLE